MQKQLNPRTVKRNKIWVVPRIMILSLEATVLKTGLDASGGMFFVSCLQLCVWTSAYCAMMEVIMHISSSTIAYAHWQFRHCKFDNPRPCIWKLLDATGSIWRGREIAGVRPRGHKTASRANQPQNLPSHSGERCNRDALNTWSFLDFVRCSWVYMYMNDYDFTPFCMIWHNLTFERLVLSLRWQHPSVPPN